MKISFPSAVLASILLCGCGARHRIQNHIPANAGVYDDAEGYAVLSLLLGGASEQAHAAVIRINMVTHVESTSGVNSLEDCMKIPEEFREAANDYELRARTPYTLRKKFAIKTPYDLAGETRITGSGLGNPPPAGQETSEKMAGGIFYLSPVGFDANHTHAIAYENYLCGNRCGWGAYHFFVKNGDKWEEAKDISGCVWQY